jgi:L-amino acid N-acyltransferase YncA
MQVVHAALEDARAVAEIHVMTWRSAYASILPAAYLASLSVERREAMWSECIAAGTPELLVAKDRDSIQGWLNFGPSRDEGASRTEAEVWAIYVAPEFWSTGTGRKLWLRAKGLMLEQGFRSCSLWVFPQNARAIKFYCAVGFVPDPAPPKSFELGGTQLEEVRYVCQLDC